MDEGCPQLLDLIPKDREWLTRSSEETIHGVSDENKLELTLAPPGSIKESNTTSRERPNSVCHFLTSPCLQNPILASPSPWQNKFHSSYLHLRSGERQIAANKESSQPCSNRAAEQSPAEKKAFSAGGSAQKRTAPSQVVGWPPIRSFRKNIVSCSSSKLEADLQDVALSNFSTPKSAENCAKSPFVKINMEGIPIGRKVDLNAYSSYEKLSLGVDELFKGLVAAKDGGKEIGELLHGTGEYTLVYEDNEGDRMLVGDVPWQMFISTVKRLRVLKSSELRAFSRRSKNGAKLSKLCSNFNF